MDLKSELRNLIYGSVFTTTDSLIVNRWPYKVSPYLSGAWSDASFRDVRYGMDTNPTQVKIVRQDQTVNPYLSQHGYDSIYISYGYSSIFFPKGFLKLENKTDLELSKINPQKIFDDYDKIDRLIFGDMSKIFNNFNFLIAVRDHYTLYQSTGYLFSSTAMKEKLSYIMGNNFLKLLSSQMPLLTTPSSNPFASGSEYQILGATNYVTDVIKFIQLTTMGYLKFGDIVTTDLMPFFKVDDEITGIMNRISAISPIINGNKVIPSFITNIVGSDVTPTSVPNGKMVLKVINDVLAEADKNFKDLGY